MHTLKRSKQLFSQSKKVLVGGVNSPVRNFSAVGGGALFAKKAKGAYLWDEDGNKYVDYVMSWGVGILGHAHPDVIKAAGKSLKCGTSFGMTTGKEVKLANLIKKHFKSIDKVRLVNSGTESCMSAIRLARAYTQKSKVIKFDGCYHGHFDGLLVKSGSGNLTFGIPSGKGIMKAYSKDTLSIPFNDVEAFKNVIKKNKGKIACVILEPVPCNTGVILPEKNFLKSIATIAKREKILLIFDEVITGFRLSLGGAQKKFNIKPDLTCLGKIIGGGLPVGAFGGRKEIMDLVSPEGPVYQAGTLSGNPIAVSAGIKTIEICESKNSMYSEIEKRTANLTDVIMSEASKKGIPVQINKIGSLFSMFFTESKVFNQKQALLSNKNKYVKVFNSLLKLGVLLPPSPFEACFVSLAHKKSELNQTAIAFKKAFKAF